MNKYLYNKLSTPTPTHTYRLWQVQGQPQEAESEQVLHGGLWYVYAMRAL